MKLKTSSLPNMHELFVENGDLLEKSFIAMNQTIQAFCQNKWENVNKFAQDTIELEKQQDRKREEIIDRIFGKETMVFSRGDRLMLVESQDTIVDKCEIVVRKIIEHQPIPIEEMAKIIGDMGHKLQELGTLVKTLVLSILEDISKGRGLIEKITDIRRDVRDSHWILLKKTYELQENPIQFFYYQTIIKDICKVADNCEEFADSVQSLLCKYA